ncbi:MAG: hypothetical protein IT384_19290 [Deltaproteobacteria bacterium]|nr:hypothetical protein [Deltaproteobacteria bacterium]
MSAKGGFKGGLPIPFVNDPIMDLIGGDDDKDPNKDIMKQIQAIDQQIANVDKKISDLQFEKTKHELETRIAQAEQKQNVLDGKTHFNSQPMPGHVPSGSQAYSPNPTQASNSAPVATPGSGGNMKV